MEDPIGAARRAMLEATGRAPRTREPEGERVTVEIREAVPTEILPIKREGESEEELG